MHTALQCSNTFVHNIECEPWDEVAQTLTEEAGLYGSPAPSSLYTSLLVLLPPELPSLQAGPLVVSLTSHQLHSPFGQEDLLRNVQQLRDRCSRTRKPTIPIRC